jgi:pimeloyl-ACP methyl ester carboxylesterase
MDLDGLSRIGCPVRLATGTASEPLYTDIARALASRIRGATVQHLEGLDHLAPVLRPDATARAIEQFIAP